MKRFVVTRTVNVRQAIVIKAENASKAIELSKKEPYKKWSTDNANRTGYNVSEFSA